MLSCFQFLQQLKNARQKVAFALRQLLGKKVNVTIQERRDVVRSGSKFVLVENVHHDSRIGHTCEFDVVKIVFDSETLLQCAFERLNAGAAGMNERPVDVEKEEALLFFCHVERSRDISHILVRLKSQISRDS